MPPEIAGASLNTAKPTSRIYIPKKPVGSPSSSNRPTRRQYLTNKPVSSFIQLTNESTETNNLGEKQNDVLITIDAPQGEQEWDFFVVADNDEPLRA